MAEDPDDYLVVGLVGRAHGLKGEVFVEPRTDEPDRRFARGAVLTAYDGSVSRQVSVAGSRAHQGRLVLRLDGIADRTAAEAARGWELRIPLDPDEVPEGEGEFYDHQLRGLAVQSPAGESIGELVRIDHGAAQDLLVVATDHGEVLVPFVEALVPEVDLAAGRVVVDDRPGLFDADREG